MKEFNNLKDALSFLQQQINSSLKEEISDLTVKTLQENMQKEVYDVYQPKKYDRAGYQGGLIDPSNIEVKLDGNTLSLESMRPDGERNVAEIVETGQGYTYNFEYAGKPRPFTDTTREELRESNKLIHSMKNGLHKRGIKTD
ncbi:hypothetical protein NBRC13296_12125 [Paenibacillus chitinolyticus]|uniref:hypothetical protein n=1 Tax=Paenibacillus chitinolyticus TaxID=79263 RepID=UPI003558F0C1